MSSPFVADPRPLAEWNPAKMGKATLFAGAEFVAAEMMVGLNSFEPSQEHAAHVHAATDKLYHVLEGEGEFEVGGEKRRLGAGALILARAGVPHGVRNPGPARLLLLVVIAPPPSK